MPRRPNTPCAGGCNRLLWPNYATGKSPTCQPCRALVTVACADCGRPFPACEGRAGSIRCRECRSLRRQRARPGCSQPGCDKPAKARELCNTHYNKANGYFIGDLVKDPDRERARLRIKTHRRKDWSRLTDITPEYEMALRAVATHCPMCSVELTDEPYLPNSKELDHIVPRGVGGTHTIGNVRILCRTCNIKRPRNGSDYTGPVTLWAQAS